MLTPRPSDPDELSPEPLDPEPDREDCCSWRIRLNLPALKNIKNH